MDPRKAAELQPQLDRLLCRDATTGAIYANEPAVVAFAKSVLPAEFVDLFMHQVHRRDAKAARTPGAKDAVVPWLTARAELSKAANLSTPESLGLGPASTLEDVRRVVKARKPDAPDLLFAPDGGAQLKQAVDRITAAVREKGIAETSEAWWTCFAVASGVNLVLMLAIMAVIGALGLLAGLGLAPVLGLFFAGLLVLEFVAFLGCTIAIGI